MTRRNHPEAAIQRAVFAHFRARGAPGVFAFHPANGCYRRPVEAKVLQGLGVTSGVPDVIAVKGSRTYALELKAEGGKLTAAQGQVLIKLREAGAMATDAHGIDQALSQLEGLEPASSRCGKGARPPRSHRHRLHWRDNLGNGGSDHE
jgi:hypothetical protein